MECIRGVRIFVAYPPVNKQKPAGKMLISMLISIKPISGKAIMPQWLSSMTGLQEWPGINAPYIHQNHHDDEFNRIIDNPLRAFSMCDTMYAIDPICSFDCYKCLAHDDIYSCDPLSQTFDDGPSASTPSLLDHLAKTKTKATFFLIGVNVVQYPEIVTRENKDGHLLAVHTWSHKFLPALSNEEVFAELQWTVWAINATAGVVPKYFRPPYGGVDNRIRSIANRLGLVTVLWDRDTGDWHLNDGSLEAHDIMSNFNSWLDTSSSPVDISLQSKRKWYSIGRNVGTSKPQGLVLEHDLSANNVALAVQIHKSLKYKQKTVAECAKMERYQ